MQSALAEWENIVDWILLLPEIHFPGIPLSQTFAAVAIEKKLEQSNILLDPLIGCKKNAWSKRKRENAKFQNDEREWNNKIETNTDGQWTFQWPLPR